MEKMPKTTLSLMVAAIFFMLSYVGTNLEVSGALQTQISISPSSQIVSTDEIFTVNITIDPAEPIVGAQCSILFDPSLLEVIDVEEGDLFDGFTRFFIKGETDNLNGTVEAVANIILGSGSVSDPGTFAIITFKAKSTAGTSPINFIMTHDGSPSTLIVGAEYQTIIPSPNNGSVTITGGAILSYSPSSHNFGDMLEGQTDSTTFEIWNSGAGTLSYSLSEACSWVSVTPTSGSSTGEHDTITVNIDTTGLSLGSHTCDISITSNGGSGTFSIEVNVVEEQPILSYSPSSHNFGDMLEGQTDSTTFEIWNSGAGTLSYSLSEACSWVSVTPTSGSSTGEHDTITVNIDTTGLSLGSHTCDISITSNGGSGTFSIEVNVISIDTVLPEITDMHAFPFHQEAGKNVTIYATVTDNVGVANVFLSITYPDSSTKNFSIFQNKTGDIYYCERPYNQLGTYTFTIFAIDTSGNGNTSLPDTFEIGDTTPPSIFNVGTSPIVKGIGDKVNISVTVTDNVGVANVFLSITYPDSSTKNFSIFQNKTGNTYYCEKTYNQLGTYTFTIFAIDTSGNGNTSIIYSFQISDVTPPTVTISYPSGGENVSGIVTIRWNATDNYYSKGNLKITLKYSDDGGNLWHLIAKNQENDGEYKWDTSDLEDGKNYRIMVKANDSKNEGSSISDVFTVDNTDPSLTLKKPSTNYLYLFDREIMPLLRRKAVIIGKITITANATDSLSGVDKVEFFVDNVSKYIDTKEPYEWEWDETIFFNHILKVVATDKAGNTAIKEINISIYNI